ncbi:MAG TPA: HRDC domain-containing protein [Thermoleophilaceae bacterium]|nr:HRDC domain-containing protein [Thermoleophilaceae bacterium]
MIEELAERARVGGRIAIDTEFVSERRYQALLCLAQVAVPDAQAPDGVCTEVIDPLSNEPLDPAPLARVLADPAVEVVMHAGRQDVAILKRSWRTAVTNVFDTQVAAGFLGYGSQEGYESLVRKVLKVQLKGTEGFTRWERRPLTRQQLEYAGDDARLLLALGERLEQRLEQRGRLEWAREESRLLEEISDERDPDRLYERLPRLGRLSEPARALARELVEWREQEARRADRPASTVLPDQALIELARRTPRDRRGLEQIRGLPPQTLHRRGGSLVEAIERGRGRPAPPSPPEPLPRDSADAPLVSLAQALVRYRSMESGIAVELIATQAELASLVWAMRRGRDGSGLRVAGGWRRELVGGELEELLAGRRTLSVGVDGRLVVSER